MNKNLGDRSFTVCFMTLIYFISSTTKVRLNQATSVNKWEGKNKTCKKHVWLCHSEL